MKRIIPLTLLVLICYNMLAQKQASVTSWRFHSINQAGVLKGENSTAFHVQTVNGFQYKQIFLGVGVGIDYYQRRSIPLFLEAKNYFGNGRNKFFVYGDGGVNFGWDKEKDIPASYSSKYIPAFYGNAGAGYLFGISKKMGLQISGGYTYKRINNEQKQNICPFVGPCGSQKASNIYDYQRLVLQIGWMF